MTMRRRSLLSALAAASVALSALFPAAAGAEGTSSQYTVANYDSFVDVRGLYRVLSADVRDAAGAPVAGAPVVFEEVNLTGGPNRILCIANSDATGRASCHDRPAVIPPKTDHTWTLAYLMGHDAAWDSARGWVGVAPHGFYVG